MKCATHHNVILQVSKKHYPVPLFFVTLTHWVRVWLADPLSRQSGLEGFSPRELLRTPRQNNRTEQQNKLTPPRPETGEWVSLFCHLGERPPISPSVCVGYPLAMEAAVHALVLDPDVASEAGGGGEGTLTLGTWKLLQHEQHTNTSG